MRAFFCIPIPSSTRRAIHQVAEALHRRVRTRASWVPEENYHITLQFLGDIDPMLTIDLQEAAERVCAAVQPFVCTLDRVGAFPRLDKARVVWFGGDAPDEFRGLASALSRELQALGFPRARTEALTHVTLARVKERPDPTLPDVVAALGPLDSQEVMVNHIVLMESRLSPRGAAYSPLCKARLGGGGG